jgi:hypothetical protein
MGRWASAGHSGCAEWSSFIQPFKEAFSRVTSNKYTLIISRSAHLFPLFQFVAIEAVEEEGEEEVEHHEVPDHQGGDENGKARFLRALGTNVSLGIHQLCNNI